MADYTIELTVDIDTFSVTGKSKINLNIEEETSYVIIHTKSMTIFTFNVIQNGNDVAVKSNFTYNENDFYILSLKNRLSVGTAILMMTYSYTMGENLVGFYRSSYKDSSGTTHWIGTTHFEPTDARRAFPCFDEPALKANFTISITHSSSLNAHSNMPVASVSEPDQGVVTTSFATSVKMSSYLVAFVVSDFTCMTKVTDTEYNVNVSLTSIECTVIDLFVQCVWKHVSTLTKEGRGRKFTHKHIQDTQHMYIHIVHVHVVCTVYVYLACTMYMYK